MNSERTGKMLRYSARHKTFFEYFSCRVCSVLVAFFPIFGGLCTPADTIFIPMELAKCELSSSSLFLFFCLYIPPSLASSFNPVSPSFCYFLLSLQPFSFSLHFCFSLFLPLSLFPYRPPSPLVPFSSFALSCCFSTIRFHLPMQTLHTQRKRTFG